MLELLKEGKLNPLVEERPMSEVPEAVALMREGKVTGRLAFVPDFQAEDYLVREK